jgi:L-fuconolactonase
VRIDAHQHFWDLRRCRYDWLREDLGVLYANHGPADLAPLLAERDIERTLLVQASDTLDETHYLLGLARMHAFVAGVVGWVPLDAPNVAETIGELAEEPHFVGVRPMLQDIADERWILRSDVARGLDAVENAGLVFDALVKAEQFESVVELARARPRLSIVLDHAAKPDVAAGTAWHGRREWRRRIADFAACENTSVKLSGLVTEAGPNWHTSDLVPVFDVLLENFGPSRVLWGSDWPVVRLAGDYARWWDATAELLAPLTEDERARILGSNALRVYARTTSKSPGRSHDGDHGFHAR